MESTDIELGVGRVTADVIAVSGTSGHFGQIGLLDEDGALMCLGTVPCGVAASLIATARTGATSEVLGTGVISVEGIGGCANYVWMRPDDPAGTGGVDPAALERLRDRRVQLGLRLVTTGCDCSRPVPEATAGARP